MDKLNAEAALQDSELRSIDAAIAEATKRLAAAQAVEAQAADRKVAEQGQAIAKRIGVRLGRVDDHFAHAFGELLSALRELDELHAAGVTHPSATQFRVSAMVCLKTVINHLPHVWRLDLSDGVEIAPGQRKTFASYWAAVQPTIANQLAARLGGGDAPKQEDAAA